MDTIANERGARRITWLPLESRMFTASAYDAERRVLYLRFRKTGDVYRYFAFPASEFQGFLDADSHGRFFLAHIRGSYEYERMANLHFSHLIPELGKFAGMLSPGPVL